MLAFQQVYRACHGRVFAGSSTVRLIWSQRCWGLAGGVEALGLAVEIMQRYTVPALCALALVLGNLILGMMSVKRYLRAKYRTDPKS